MTIEQFKTVAPSEGNILLYYTSGLVVSAMNVSIVSTGGRNIAESLKRCTQVTLTVTSVGSETKYQCIVKPETIQPYTGYYFFEIETITISPLSSSELDTNITFIFPNPDSENFDISDYDALKNNADSNRTTKYIYDVDRTKKDNIPGNYQAILSGSATPASYQELNYTSTGIVRSRYSGAKTTIVDYGVNSAINAQPLEGSIYLSSSLNSFICSQSLADRDVDELLFSTPETVPPGEENLYGLFPVSGSRIFNLIGNRIVPLRDRKVWSKTNTTIYYIDKDGYSVDSGSACSI